MRCSTPSPLVLTARIATWSPTLVMPVGSVVIIVILVLGKSTPDAEVNTIITLLRLRPLSLGQTLSRALFLLIRRRR